MDTFPRSYTPFSTEVVHNFLREHKNAWSDFHKIWPGVSKEYIYKIFSWNQTKWNSFKWLIKRIEKGALSDIWLEERSFPASLKQLRAVFEGSVVRTYDNHPVDHHKYQYYKGLTHD